MVGELEGPRRYEQAAGERDARGIAFGKAVQERRPRAESGRHFLRSAFGEIRTKMPTRRTAAALLVATIAACSKKDAAGTPAPADAAAMPAPTIPASFDRSFRGTIGDGLGVTMHLTKKDAVLTGTYAYDSTKRDIALTGTMSGLTAFDLKETVDGKATGSFNGTFAPDGSASGTWSDASGAKSLRFAIHEEAVAKVSPPPAPPSPGARSPLASVNDNEVASFLVQFAKSKKAPGAASTTAEALADYNDMRLRSVVAFQQKYGLPILDSSFFVVYLADVNNDGTNDWVLTSRNDVGLHNDDIAGVFTPKGTGFDELTPPRTGPLAPNRVQFFGKNFLSHDPEGVTMSFVEQKAEKRYLWKNGTLKLLDSTPAK